MIWQRTDWLSILTSTRMIIVQLLMASTLAITLKLNKIIATPWSLRANETPIREWEGLMMKMVATRLWNIWSWSDTLSSSSSINCCKARWRTTWRSITLAAKTFLSFHPRKLSLTRARALFRRESRKSMTTFCDCSRPSLRKCPILMQWSICASPSN